MYMRVPNLNIGDEQWKNNAHKYDVTNSHSKAKDSFTSEEHNKLWQELRHSGRELDRYYDVCRSSIFEFKERFDEIKKKEILTESLKEIYYGALSSKNKHEEDRDNYFKCEKNLEEMKREFVDGSQQLALESSRYVEFGQRFASEREEFLCKLILDIDQVNAKNKALREDKTRLNSELRECREKIHQNESDLREMTSQNEKLEKTKKDLEKTRETLKKEATWMSRQNSKLKESNIRYEREVTSLSDKVREQEEEKEKKDEREKELEERINDLDSKCSRLQQILESYKGQLEDNEAEMTQARSKFEREKSDLNSKLRNLTSKIEKTTSVSAATMLRNQQLREKLKNAKHRNESVVNHSHKMAAKEQRTRINNAELASKQLALVDEVLELKEDFFRDQNRMKKAGKLNTRLQRDVDALRHRIQVLKEDPTAIDPLEGIAEYREAIKVKYAGSKLDRSFFRPTTSSVTSKK